MADIASCLGMSSATIYRFFPSRAAINRSICGHRANYPVGGCSRSARGAPAHEKLESLFNLLHEERRKNLIQERPVHDLIVAATLLQVAARRADIDKYKCAKCQPLRLTQRLRHE
ncbi:TetR family transcriptional regulator [Rhizobium mongolense]|uniref:TetR family transcriptional regulator n=1 Tax=Rhizobium mongolense TaxID=57676 RepID=UPI001F3C50AB|nr:TetR family transcriptional regulator [Rhizobium mongolense]